MQATALHNARCPRTWIEICPVNAKRWCLGRLSAARWGLSYLALAEIAMPGHMLTELATR